MNYFKQLELLTENAKDSVTRMMKEAGRIDLYKAADVMDLELIEDLPEIPYSNKKHHQEMAGIIAVRYTETGRVEFDGVMKGESFPLTTVVDLTQMHHEDIIYVADLLERRTVCNKETVVASV